MRILTLVGLLLLAAPVVAQQTSRENYLPNPGFEEGLKFWHPSAAENGVISLDDKVKRSGKYSLRFEYKKDADPRLSSYIYMSNQIGAILDPGKTYTVSGWIKMDAPGGRRPPSAYLTMGDGRQGASKRIEKTSDWTFVSFHLKPPEEAKYFQFRCQAHAVKDGMSGTIWFDDLKVEEGDTPSAFRPDWIDASEFYTREPKVPWYPLPVDFRCSDAVATPHVPVARPYAQGSLRILWFGFWNNARIPVELAQRGDFVLDTAMANGSTTDRTPIHALHVSSAKVFRERLGVEPPLPPEKAPQALVIEQGAIEMLNSRDRRAILERVRGGMGCVVLLGPIHVKEHPGAIATPKIKALLDEAAKLTEPGCGRVLTVANPPASHSLWVRGVAGIEMAYAAVVQAVYESARRTPAPVKVAPVPVAPKGGQPWQAQVQFSAPAVEVSVLADLPVEDDNRVSNGHGANVPREIVATAKAALPAGRTSVTIDLPALPGGAYCLVARGVDAEGRVTGWAFSRMTITPEVQVALDAGDRRFQRDVPLPVECRIQSAAAIATAQVSGAVTDPFGRVLARLVPAPLALQTGETSVKLAIPLAHAESCAARLDIEVRARDRLLGRACVWLSTEALAPTPDFHLGPYDDHYQVLRDLGADMAVNGGRPDLGLRPYPWVNLLQNMGKAPAMTDPATLETAIKYVVDAAVEASQPLHVVGVILHDEVDSVGFREPPVPSDLAFFRNWLKDTYGTVDALNRSWGKGYRDWAEIDFDATKFNFVTDAGKNPAPWADRQAASEAAAHRFYSALDAGVRKADSAARIGPSGTRDSSGVNGFDWWLLMKDYRAICLYAGVHGDMVHSFAGPGCMVTRWAHLNALENADGIRQRLWRDVLLHRTGAPTYGGRFTNLVFPDYRPKPGALALAEELDDVRSGLGRLFMRAQPDNADTAVFYSPSNYRAHVLEAQKPTAAAGAGAHNKALASLVAALGDARVGTHFVSYEQVAEGLLKPGAPKALFLWGALVLSEKEAAAIRTFAQDGGVVIADLEPGLYDEHCHKLPQGRLHDLFAEGTARLIGRGKVVQFSGISADYVRLEGWGIGGEAAQEAKAKESAETVAKLSAMLSKEAGILPALRLTDAAGAELFQETTCFSFTDGPARYVGILVGGKHGETRKGRLALSDARPLYDCRAGRFLGTGPSWDLEMRCATANLYALLPHRVVGLTVTAPATVKAGGAIEVSASLAMGQKGATWRHVLVTQLQRPDGKQLTVDRRVYETADSEIKTTLFTALNDPPGRWKLIVTDAATGTRGEAQFTLTKETP